TCFLCFFSGRRRHTGFSRDWSSDVCSSDLANGNLVTEKLAVPHRTALRRVKEPELGEIAVRLVLGKNPRPDAAPVFHKVARADRSEERRVGIDCSAQPAPIEDTNQDRREWC